VLPLAGAIVATGLGLLIRYVPDYGFWPKYGGVAMWSAALYMTVLIVAPRLNWRRALGLTIAIGWGVEFLQMTPLPGYLSSKHILLRLLVGEQFNPPDLAALVVGAVLSAAAHAGLFGRGRSC
jgi:hypothetical protein